MLRLRHNVAKQTSFQRHVHITLCSTMRAIAFSLKKHTKLNCKITPLETLRQQTCSIKHLICKKRRHSILKVQIRDACIGCHLSGNVQNR